MHGANMKNVFCIRGIPGKNSSLKSVRLTGGFRECSQYHWAYVGIRGARSLEGRSPWP